MSVPKAFAIDSGLTSAVVPSPNDETSVEKASSSATTPASSMICLIRSRPASMASGTYTVFTEPCSARFRLRRRLPLPSPEALQ